MQSVPPTRPDDPIPSQALATLWQCVCGELASRIGPAEFERWFSPVNLVRLDTDSLWLLAPNTIYSLWIEENYLDVLNAAVGAHLPKHPPIKFEIAPPTPLARAADADGQPDHSTITMPAVSPSGPLKPFGPGPSASSAAEALESAPDPKKRKPPGADAGLGEAYRFDNFVVGFANRLAAAAAKAVAEKPGKTYHPLFIHAASGLGKTHLLHAIGWDSLGRRPRSRVIYITAEKFANEFIEALQKNNLVAFRKRFREADMLLIDDVQFLSGKEGMQEEFFHTFNSLTDRHKQIVLACDRPASEIRELEERLVSRFKWGMTAEIAAPGQETRLAILRSKRDERQVPVPDWALEYIAEHVSSNVRALEGALLRTGAFTSFDGGEAALTETGLRDLLADYIEDAGTAREIAVREILDHVATHYGIETRELTGKRRTSRLVEARHMAMTLAREVTELSLAEIGKEFGGRDHGTVINACRKIAAKIDASPTARRTLDFLRRGLVSAPARRTKSSPRDKTIPL